LGKTAGEDVPESQTSHRDNVSHESSFFSQVKAWSPMVLILGEYIEKPPERMRWHVEKKDSFFYSCAFYEFLSDLW
jgi:hypothetical protein